MIRLTNFNSCMVRLKVENVRTYDSINKFQFLYGTIKRYIGQWGGVNFTAFQFLYGTIKSRSVIPSRASSKRISIPVWYD